ncbi:hypothetical protein MSAN_01294400 [Mycena sanguinolenta]|uniref:Uncharacterized protein n=1 Tax=Mycena sanguinolenta TaxID=230812 RepID=A0A8H7D2C3_9AGAR|nr:hypothetical protein MSAN_01294400 [Mycena sanguinolenta]
MSTFTPTSPVNMSNERDWANNLGMLDWDSTSIVFTKRTLMEFLKYGAIYSLTYRFADENSFHDMSSLAKSLTPILGRQQRRLRLPCPQVLFRRLPPQISNLPGACAILPGGPRTNIFADEEIEDALSTAPPRREEAAAVSPAAVDVPAGATATEKNEGNATTGTGIKPSRHVRDSCSASVHVTCCRRVREAPGGNSSLGSIWGNDEPEEFKPTRRVRQAPGGGVSGVGVSTES